MFVFNKYSRVVSIAAVAMIFVLAMVIDTFGTEMSSLAARIIILIGYAALGVVVAYGALALFNVGAYALARIRVITRIRR
jgi:hypothetical protein